MADVLLFVVLLLANFGMYLFGFVVGKQACEQSRRDDRSMRKYATFQGKTLSKDEFEDLF